MLIVRWDGQPSNHTFRLLSKHSISPSSATLKMPDETDTKILTASPLGELEETTGCRGTMWMKTIPQDLKSNNLSLNEATDTNQNPLHWRLMFMLGAMHS